MRNLTPSLVVIGLVLLTAGCIPMPTNNSGAGTPSLSSEMFSVCGQALGPTVKPRVDAEWQKHASVESRQLIESVASIILTTPGVPGTERQSMYQNYLTCASGIYLMNRR